MKKNLLYLLFCLPIYTYSFPYPITFCMPEDKIVKSSPEKTQDFAFIVAGEGRTYIYTEEKDYYNDYQRSYYAITKKKGGWDCMRHYEILANGCIPYFLDLDKCEEQTMFFLPKDLIKQAMNIPGVSEGKIDHNLFDKEKYYELLEKLLTYTREVLTTRHMAEYVLKTINYSGDGKILYLSQDPAPDYMRCLLLIGFKQLLQDRVVDYPKIEHIYTNYSGDTGSLYGRGFTYTKNVEELPIDRTNIEERIRNKEFDLVIYGSIHRGLPYHDLVTRAYDPDHIAYFCGEDDHPCGQYDRHNLFLREFSPTEEIKYRLAESLKKKQSKNK